MKEWRFKKQDIELQKLLSAKMGISGLLANILVQRGIKDEDAAGRFINCELTSLHNPFLFKDMKKAADRIDKAIHEKEKIMIYGDYDVDGIAGTAILISFFHLIGIKCDYFLPHRIQDGYGMNIEHIKDFTGKGYTLIITVDNGTSAFEVGKYLKEHNVDLIILDHHEMASEPPLSYAFLNPKNHSDSYPFFDLAGSGVAYKLAWALAETLSFNKRVNPEFRVFLLNATALAAMGTIADVAPLIDENRVLVKYGLASMSQGTSPGISAILKTASISSSSITPKDISFYIAPRINAVGRLDQAFHGVELLTTNSTEKAYRLCAHLEDKNTERRSIQNGIFGNVEDKIGTDPSLIDRFSFVFADESWHPGVIGIVASKTAEKYMKPTVIIALDESKGRGSARTVPGFHILNALKLCGANFTKLGGHEEAAGFEIERAGIDDLIIKFERYAETLFGGKRPVSFLDIDADIFLSTLSHDTVKDMEALKPYGEKNPEPVFATKDISIAGEPQVMGKSGRHVSFFVKQHSNVFRVVGFGMADIIQDLKNHMDNISIAYTPVINTWGGRSTVELMLKDIKFN